MNNHEIKIEAMRAANAAMSTSKAYNQMGGGVSTNPNEVLALARTIYSWFVEEPAPAVKRVAPRAKKR